MSNIVSSSYAADPPQVDGRFYVVETFVDVAGVAHTQTWLASPSDDVSAALVIHADVLSQALNEQEVAANLAAIMAAGAAATPTNAYSSVADNVAAVFEAYPSMSVGAALMVADYLVAQTDEVLEGDYGMSADQVSVLRALPTLEQQSATLAQVVA